MVEKSITFVPGLYKIFDEILVNAADNKQRDQHMSFIKININQENNCISIMNDGHGIPIEIHKDENIYVPELIFGHLLTSSNYNDNEKKVTGGRNGYGAKLTNIFSKCFIVETCNKDRKLEYKQIFENNMSVKHPPTIKKSTSKDWTRITFYPDLDKFGMKYLDNDIVSLMVKRVYDLAGCTDKSVKIFLNDSQIPIKNFKEYVDMYLNPEEIKIYQSSERWEICVGTSNGNFQQVSFVNSISTWKGGSHVKYISEKVINCLLTSIEKKYKEKLKSSHIKNHLWIFVNSLIENPSFDSQTKENLTSRPSSFGSSFELSDKFCNQLVKSGIIDKILSWYKFKESKDLKKTDGKKRNKLVGIPKLEDANEAGGRKASKCTLILTEGDSAKALAMSGISVIGRDYYGVFPLKGKLLNVRDAKHEQIMNNQEITFLKQIIGLQQGKVYTDVSSLRYGHVMIMVDQDHDGSHIKGLLINLFHTYWPDLLKIPGFLTQFITPIVKCSSGYNIFSFYTIPEYENWKQSVGDNIKKWHVKYYKGLGTSTSKEAREYFSKLDKHQISFEWYDDKDSESIKLAFLKTNANKRKEWLTEFKSGTYISYNPGECINYTDFINKELILFSNTDNIRSIPNICDGLKPGQRKILYSCFKKNIDKEIKVAQLSGIVSQLSSYHHGEVSLCGTIVNMAQDYIGSNNINLLLPIGQFGTRHLLGKDCASPRYIYTALNPISRLLFPKQDDSILTYCDDDGKSIEPEWFIPIIPMILVNGADGIGTGWSTFIPTFNPLEIVDNILMFLNNESMNELHPWYRGFRGVIQKSTEKNSYDIYGNLEIVNENTIRIFELPIRKSTDSYKEMLEDMVQKNNILEFTSHHSDSIVEFRVTVRNAYEKDINEWLKYFKLYSSISMSNMVLFNYRNKLQRYNNVLEILEEFIKVRMKMYEKRRTHMIQVLERIVVTLNNKVRFINYVVSGRLVINNKSKENILNELVELKFENDGEEFDYLLSMKLWSFTKEKIKVLEKELEDKMNELQELEKTSGKELWIKELKVLREKIK